jgi:hypothetical protein
LWIRVHLPDSSRVDRRLLNPQVRPRSSGVSATRSRCPIESRSVPGDQGRGRVTVRPTLTNSVHWVAVLEDLLQRISSSLCDVIVMKLSIDNTAKSFLLLLRLTRFSKKYL